MPGYFVNTAVLYGVAVAAYQRMAHLPDRDSGGHQETLVAVVFAAAAVEAFLNETVAAAEGALSGGASDPVVRNYHAMLHEAEESNFSLRMKIVFAHKAFDKGCDWGAHPLQDFGQVIELRNAIMHFRPGDTWVEIRVQRDGVEKIDSTFEPAEILKKLKPTLLSDHPVKETPWIQRMGTKALARWACNTASAVIQLIAGIPPFEMPPDGSAIPEDKIAGVVFKSSLEVTAGACKSVV